MEYLMIIFPERREVLIDGILSGISNQKILIEGGTHSISLDGTRNFEPSERIVEVKDTTPISPALVEFEMT